MYPTFQISDATIRSPKPMFPLSSTHFPVLGQVTHLSSIIQETWPFYSSHAETVALPWSQQSAPSQPLARGDPPDETVHGRFLPTPQPAPSLNQALSLQLQVHPMSFLIRSRVHWQVPQFKWPCPQSQSVYKSCTLD